MMNTKNINIKILISIVLSICFIFLFSSVASAEEYVLSKLDVSVDIPSDWYVFDFENDMQLSNHRIDQETLDNFISTYDTDSSTYLYAISPDFGDEIRINYSKNTQKVNFSSLSISTLEDLAKEMKKVITDSGISNVRTSLIDGSHTRFIRIIATEPQKNYNSISYNTASTDYMIMIIYKNASGISAENKEFVSSIANSLTGLSDKLFAPARKISTSKFDFEKLSEDVVGACILGGVWGIVSTFIKKVKNGNSNVEKENDLEIINIKEEPNTNVVEKADTIVVEETNTNSLQDENTLEKGYNVCEDENIVVEKIDIENRFCRICGAKLNADSKFCHKCGTAVITNESEE